MPTLPIGAITYAARVSILQLALPGEAPVNIGVLLEDVAADRLYLRLRRDWDLIAPDEADVLSELAADLESRASEIGAARLLERLTDTLSNTIGLTDPREVIVEDFSRGLGRLYREHVQSRVQPFQTHLPRYNLAVAAGSFLENPEITEDLTDDDWEEVPAGSVKPQPGMFVARVVGRSMEPRIPDGSLCVFRRFGAGSREGRLVLVESLEHGTNDRYTVKRYHSEKTQGPSQEQETWEHSAIRLEPLNPEFEAWYLKLEENRYRILAEFVAVLD
jgi:SOS-response transcriptional repressor LexA